MLEFLWTGKKFGPGIPLSWGLGSRRICKYPMSGSGTGMHVCGKRPQAFSSYCTCHHRLCYYKPARKLQNPTDKVQSIAPAKPGANDHRVMNLFGEEVE